MNKFMAFIFGWAGVWLSGCSPAVFYDLNPSVNIVPFKTYAFLPKVDSSKVSVYNSDIIDELIHKSIVAEMNSRISPWIQNLRMC